jgi:hypothetical protein
VRSARDAPPDMRFNYETKGLHHLKYLFPEVMEGRKPTTHPTENEPRPRRSANMIRTWVKDFHRGPWALRRATFHREKATAVAGSSTRIAGQVMRFTPLA